MKTITLTQKDIEKAKLQNSPSGMLIDELAYSAGEWTSEDLYNNSYEYEPSEPYCYNYEADLFEATKTFENYLDICDKVQADKGSNDILVKCKQSKLQCGAFIALNYQDRWQELLAEYTQKLKDDGVDGISQKFNTELQEAKDDYMNDQYKEWLHGDHQNYAGVVSMIARNFTESEKGEYNQKEHTYTFTLDDQDIENAQDGGYNKNQLKAWLLDSIVASGNDRSRKDKEQREANKIERERIQAYKAQQKSEAEAERKAKLLAMTL